ncbi:hypothetical protein AB8S08_04950 [Pseudidiomarina sp. PP-1MA]|uniref:Lipoprotein n=1 Tax=Pseudidiomarina sp. PP-1MA TaxID=3237706 RepID=A0AB39X973_9GAMM
MKSILVVLSLGLLTACATGYQAHTWSGGYKDSKLGDGHYLVEYYGNGTTLPATVEQFWAKRATELCPTGFEAVNNNTGATDGGIFVGGAVSIDHPWKKAEIKCK